MGWFFILVGAVLLIIAFYQLNALRERVPGTPITGYLLYALGVSLLGVACYLFYNVPTKSGWYAFSFFVGSIVSFGFGVWAVKVGRQADKHHAENMAALASAAKSLVERHQSSIVLSYADEDARQHHLLDTDRVRTEMRQMETQRTAAATQQRELELRQHLAPVAEQHGLDVGGLVGVNIHKYKTDIDLNFREQEYRQDQENIDRVEQSHLNQIDDATERLFRMYEQRKVLEGSSDPAKDDKLHQLNYNIKVAERLIRGQSDRHLQAAPGKKTRRNLPKADGRSDYPAASEPDDY